MLKRITLSHAIILVLVGMAIIGILQGPKAEPSFRTTSNTIKI